MRGARDARGASGSLRAVGTGIRAIGQSSPEAVACIERADKVFFMLGDPLARAWVKRLNGTAESLIRLYAPGKERLDTYNEVIDTVLSTVRERKDVCMVTTGHPGVFSYAAQQMIRRARAEGYDACMLPGISAEDCLFADVGIDPGDGLASYEATRFLVSRPPFDACSSLVLWQIGAIGEWSCQEQAGNWNPSGLGILADVLAETYGANHTVVVYEAARYCFTSATTQHVPLGRLGDARVTVLSTLYVPARAKRPVDEAMAARLAASLPHGSHVSSASRTASSSESLVPAST